MLEPAPHPSTQAFAYDETQPVACTTTVVGAVGDPCQMGTSTDMDVEKHPVPSLVVARRSHGRLQSQARALP